MVRLRSSGLLGRSTLMAFLAGVALITTAAVVLSAITSSHPPRQAKEFTLGRLGHPGARVALSHYAGRPVIVNFFNSWCHACRRETPVLADFYRSHRGRVLVIGVDANDNNSWAVAFAREHGLDFPVAFDGSASVALSYGVIALPQTFFLNAKHQIVRHIFGGVVWRQS